MNKTIVRRPRCDSTLDPQLHPIIARIYQGRGIQSHDQLETGVTQLHSWEHLTNIKQASELLYQALLSQQRILIIGDFDADGATSTAIAVSALKQLGFQSVHYLVPNRFTYGYGLTPEIVNAAIQQFNPELIITVDNGVSSHKGVDEAKKAGITVLITDHHLPGETLPNADAIVNPNLVSDLFPSKSLAGCGVIFYVMLALRHLLREKNYFLSHKLAEPNLAGLLDYVALGTIADVVNLDKNNRILVYQGLKRIKAKQCHLGILALIAAAGRTPEQLTATDLAFMIAPRLNAAGRLDDMSLGIACLLEENIERAQAIALQLNTLNEERREIEKKMQADALQTLSAMNIEQISHAFGLCLYDQNWHQGVIGILAGRIKDRLHRPVIAFASASETELKGSARSIPGIHIRDILDEIATRHPDLLEKFGGHAMAAGLTLQKAHFKRFSRIFNATIEKRCTPELLAAHILTDGELSYQEMSLELAELIQQAGPWGTAFPEPVFDNHFQVLQQTLLGGKHLKLRLGLPGYPGIFDAIAFNVETQCWPNPKAEMIHAVYRLDINEYRGLRKIQLIIDYLIKK